MKGRAPGVLAVITPVLVVLALAALSCASDRRKTAAPVREVSPLSNQPVVTGKELEAILLAQPTDEPEPSPGVSGDELEEIRSVVLQYYQREKPWRWEVFVEELRKEWISQVGDLPPGFPPSSGGWQFGSVEGRFVLVRQPPLPDELPAVLVYFGVYLAKESGAWRVTGEYELQQKIGPAP